MRKRGLITIVVLVVTVIFLLRCVPIPAHAEGPTEVKQYDWVVVSSQSWGYYNPNCYGQEGERMKSASPVQYYRNCVFARKPGGFVGQARSHLLFGYESNGTIRVCTTGWFWWCRWFPKGGVYPTNKQSRSRAGDANSGLPPMRLKFFFDCLLADCFMF